MRVVVTGGAGVTVAVIDDLSTGAKDNLAGVAAELHVDSILDAVGELESVMGRSLAREHGPPRPGDARRSQDDGSRLRAPLPDAERVPFREGLETMVAWFRTLETYATVGA